MRLPLTDRGPWPLALIAVAAALVVVNAAFLTAGSRAVPSEDDDALPVESATEDPTAVATAPLTEEPEASPEPDPTVAPEPTAEPDPAAEPLPLVDAPDGLAAFAGLSTWIDVYDIEWTAEEQVARAAAGGVEVLFLQSGKFDSPGDLHDPERFGRTIELAHDAGMKVVVWYVPDFVDHARDLHRSKVAINYRSPRGDRADAFGLDIETEYLANHETRTRRLLWMSRQLRAWTGDGYPMAAIVLPPLQLDLRPSWWPDFPYAELTEHYDVFVPMSYSSFRGTDADTTYRWNLGNIEVMRERAGDPDLPVHLAAGIADELPAIDAFLASVRDGEVLGAGLYDLHTTQPEDWPALRRLRVSDR